MASSDQRAGDDQPEGGSDGGGSAAGEAGRRRVRVRRRRSPPPRATPLDPRDKEAEKEKKREGEGKAWAPPDPFRFVHPHFRSKAFGLALTLSVLVMVALQQVDLMLRTPEARLGIVSFELAFKAERADAIVASWQGARMFWAGLSLGLDGLFAFAYGSTLALAVSGLAKMSKRPKRIAFGLGLAWLQVVAAVLDLTENYALIRILGGARSALYAPLAGACAAIKFGLVGIGLAYVFFGALRRLPTLLRG